MYVYNVYTFEKMVRRLGKNQVKLLSFARRNKGWHSFSTDSETKRLVNSLVKKKLLKKNKFNQFKAV